MRVVTVKDDSNYGDDSIDTCTCPFLCMKLNIATSLLQCPFVERQIELYISFICTTQPAAFLPHQTPAGMAILIVYKAQDVQLIGMILKSLNKNTHLIKVEKMRQNLVKHPRRKMTSIRLTIGSHQHYLSVNIITLQVEQMTFLPDFISSFF